MESSEFRADNQKILDLQEMTDRDRILDLIKDTSIFDDQVRSIYSSYIIANKNGHMNDDQMIFNLLIMLLEHKATAEQEITKLLLERNGEVEFDSF